MNWPVDTLLWLIIVSSVLFSEVFSGTASHLKHLSKDQRKKAEELAYPNQLLLHDYREKEILKKDAGRYIEEYYIMKNMVNPSIMNINSNRMFICWRTGLYKGSHLKFGYLNLNSFAQQSPENVTNALFLSSKDFPFAPYFRGLGVPRQNEARILVQNNGRISFTYAGNVKYKPVTQHISYAHIDNDKLSFDREVYWLQYAGDQKNWVPFDYHDGIFFVQQYQPMHVVTVDSRKSYGSNTLSVKTVARATHRDILPWNTTLFGSSIRGGSQALLLPDKSSYFAIFHTSVVNPPDKIILTYFMGALLFNSTAPFNIIAMSEVPIYKKDIYSGPWSRGGLDYVVFPTSIFYSEDRQHVWIGAGHQDRDGLLMKLNLQGLLASLKPVVPGLRVPKA